MSSIGDIFWRLGVEDAGFQAEVTRAATKAGDKAGATLGQRLSLGFKQAGKGILAGLGIGSGIAAFGALESGIKSVVGFLGDATAAATADAESQSRLAASLRANVPAWGGNATAIEKLIHSNEKLAFTDEEQRSALVGLVAATHDATKAQEILSLAMDLARFKHISLQEASDALVKVEAGRFRILASLGIVLQKGATQEQALAAVRKVAAGQAIEFSKTQAGLDAANDVAMKELSITLGRKLLPVAKAFGEFTRDVLIPALTGVVQNLGTVGKVVLPLAKVAIPLLVVAVGVKLVNAFKAFRLSTLGALGPLGLLIAAAAALNEATPTVSNFFDTLVNGQKANKVLQDLANLLGGDQFKAVILRGWKVGVEDFQKALDAANGDAEVAFNAIKDNAGDVGKALDDLSLKHDPVAMFKGWGPRIAVALRGSASKVSEAAKTTFSPIAGYISDFALEAIATAKALPGDISDAITGASKDVTGGMDDLVQLMKDALTPAHKIARDEGILSSKALAAGLADSRPEVRAKAQEVRDAAIRELELLKTGAEQIAVDTGVNLEAGLQKAREPVKQAADGLRLRIAKALQFNARPAGVTIGENWADGIIAGLHAREAAFRIAVGRYAGKLIPASPSPPEGPLHGVDKGGLAIGTNWSSELVAGVLGGTHHLDAALTTLASQMQAPAVKGTPYVPRTGAAILRAGAAVVPAAPASSWRSGVGQTVNNPTYNYNLTVTGNPKVDTARQALDELQRLQRLSVRTAPAVRTA